jgi:hypothetical protein
VLWLLPLVRKSEQLYFFGDPCSVLISLLSSIVVELKRFALKTKRPTGQERGDEDPQKA